MKAKKGISLIVLVITIIVIIILAAAVLLSLSKNNPMDSARTATYENDVAEVKSAVALYVSNFVATDYYHNGPFDTSKSAEIQVGVNKGSPVSNAEHTPVTAVKSGDTSTTVEYNTRVSWADLGLTGSSQPKSIDTCTYNPNTGVFTFTPAAGYKAQQYNQGT